MTTLPTLRLQHIHLPLLTTYPLASVLQNHYVQQHLSHAASPTKIPPNPTLLTFQTTPTYTCGRRELNTLTPSQITLLRHNGQAAFYEALRGGQTTFHGPGQLTAYLICSLRAHGLNTRTYVKLLEESVIATCAANGLRTVTRDDQPGVWLVPGKADGEIEREGEGAGEGGGMRKVCSIGVHLRRFVSSHGVGLNVCTDLGWFKRITACGMPGDVMTNLFEHGAEFGDGIHGGKREALQSVARGEAGKSVMRRVQGVMEEVAGVLAETMSKRLLRFEGGVEKRELDEEVTRKAEEEMAKEGWKQVIGS